MVVKSQIVLYIYDKLKNGEKIYLNDILSMFDISLSSFRRYISEINSFLMNNYKNQQVTYDRHNNCYVLK